MKKSFFVVLCALLLVVTGCGKKNQVTCTAKAEEGGVKINAKVVADFDKSDKLKDASVTYEFNDKKTAESYCGMFKLFIDKDKGVEVKCSGKKITIKGYANITSDDEEDEKMIGMSKDKFIKLMENDSDEKYTCK